eukprot:SAG11_NODE_4010_length_2108_cov_26.223992_1_plen_159_part_10
MRKRFSAANVGEVMAELALRPVALPHSGRRSAPAACLEQLQRATASARARSKAADTSAVVEYGEPAARAELFDPSGAGEAAPVRHTAAAAQRNGSRERAGRRLARRRALSLNRGSDGTCDFAGADPSAALRRIGRRAAAQPGRGAPARRRRRRRRRRAG